MENPQAVQSASWKSRVFKGRFGRTILIVVIGLAILSWIVVGTLLATVEMTTLQRSAAITVAAVMTEAVLWTCAAVFGVSLFQVIKRRFGSKK